MPGSHTFVSTENAPLRMIQLGALQDPLFRVRRHPGAEALPQGLPGERQEISREGRR